MVDWIFNPEIWMALATLTLLEIVLGVDNIIFIAILAGRLPKHQQARGRSIGLTRFQTLLYIIWPQALKRMIPPLGNQFIISLKDTSLLVVIGVGELTLQGQEVIAVNFRAFEVWLTVALMYLVMTMTLAKGLNFFERKLEIEQ